jgi:hypothetical protein
MAHVDLEVGRRLGRAGTYSTSITAAFEIVRHLQGRGYYVDLLVTPQLTRCAISETTTGAITLKDCRPNELPLAICQAYLLLPK